MSQNWSTPSLSSVEKMSILLLNFHSKLILAALCHVTITQLCMYFTIYAKSPACPRAICLLVSLQSPDEDDPWVCSWPTLSVSEVTRAGSGHRSALLWRSIVTPAQPAATLALNWQVLLAEITQYSERKLLLKLTTLWYWSFLISRNSSPDHFSKNFTICSERDIVTNSF